MHARVSNGHVLCPRSPSSAYTPCTPLAPPGLQANHLASLVVEPLPAQPPSQKRLHQ